MTNGVEEKTDEGVCSLMIRHVGRIENDKIAKKDLEELLEEKGFGCQANKENRSL